MKYCTCCIINVTFPNSGLEWLASQSKLLSYISILKKEPYSIQCMSLPCKCGSVHGRSCASLTLSFKVKLFLSSHAHPCTVIISPGSIRPVKCLSVFRMRLKLQRRRKYQKPDTHTTVSEAHFIVLFFSYQSSLIKRKKIRQPYAETQT